MNSIIFQGAVSVEAHDSLRRSIARLRAIAPEVRVIISTWRSISVPDLGQNVTVYSDDLPGHTPPGYKACNLHRQIASTAAGVSAANDGVCAKLRTDVEIADAKRFIQVMKKTRCSALNFDQLVTAIDYSSVDPLRNDMPLLYHVCDWVYVGNKSDLARIFSVPLPPPGFFEKYTGAAAMQGRLAGYAESLRAETYLASYVIGRNFWTKNTTPMSISRYAAIRSNIAIAENFELESLSNLGLVSTRHNVKKFNPNRYSRQTSLLWRNIPRSGFARIRRKALISTYYLQRPLLGQMRTIANLIKSRMRRVVSN